MRSENQKLLFEKSKSLKSGSSAPRQRAGGISLGGNFSFYPTLFIASQEMFVNCEFRVPKTAQMDFNS
jgi:hypothetical protein